MSKDTDRDTLMRTAIINAEWAKTLAWAMRRMLEDLDGGGKTRNAAGRRYHSCEQAIDILGQYDEAIERRMTQKP